jgi:hypothetical protein
MRTLTRCILAVGCLALGAATVSLPRRATTPREAAAAETMPISEAGRSPATRSPATHAGATRGTARAAVPQRTAPDDRPTLAELPEAEQDTIRRDFQDRMRTRLQADTATRIDTFQVAFDLDEQQTRRVQALVDAEIDTILDLQQDALDGVSPEEQAGELLAAFDASEDEAATFLDGDQLDAFIAMRRAG